MGIIDLSELKWTLKGWRPYAWLSAFIGEAQFDIVADIGPFDVELPSSVQAVLLGEGVIPDWNMGLNSRACEWVENRHWEFSTVLEAGMISEGHQVCMKAPRLDYSGWIYVDNKRVCEFHGTLIEHRFDLTEFVADGKEHCLQIIFEDVPREQGHHGFTSRSRYIKPRYNYGWDWCPRFVPIGIWGELTLEYGDSLSIELTDVESELNEDNVTGRLSLAVDVDRDVSDGRVELVAVLTDGNQQIGSVSQSVTSGTHTLDFDALSVEPWWPNMMGQAKVYELKVSARKNDQVIWSRCRNIGFKRIKWLPCQDAPADAKPWICEVNGKEVFLQGVNWTPLDANYIDTLDEQYEEVVSLYREMGCNIFRVWGGGIIEKDVFYELCDKNGILVWQDFPMSSSGIENYPPESEIFISEITAVAKSYVHRLKHHVSLLLWSGGNELTERDKVGTPIDKNHPCIVAMRDVVEKYDASRRFVETSPSGPRFQAHPDDYGKGIHHDVHGPWGFDANVIPDLDTWYQYWKGDDALFRSEVGMPAAANLETIKKYDDGMVWPPEGEFWCHTAAWWTQWKQFKPILQDKSEEFGLPEYVRLTQEQQAKAYEVAAKSCKKRFPQCGGFIIWMGHDSFPCPANNSAIDYGRKPKAAYHALKKIFRSD